MRSNQITVGSQSNNWCPCKKVCEDRGTHREKARWCWRERVERCHCKPRIAGNHQKPGERHEQILLQSPQKELTLLTPRFQTSSFQNCETIHFYCFCHPVYDIFLRQPQETNRQAKFNSLYDTWTLTSGIVHFWKYFTIIPIIIYGFK